MWWDKQICQPKCPHPLKTVCMRLNKCITLTWHTNQFEKVSQMWNEMSVYWNEIQVCKEVKEKSIFKWNVKRSSPSTFFLILEKSRYLLVFNKTITAKNWFQFYNSLHIVFLLTFERSFYLFVFTGNICSRTSMFFLCLCCSEAKLALYEIQIHENSLSPQKTPLGDVFWEGSSPLNPVAAYLECHL